MKNFYDYTRPIEKCISKYVIKIPNEIKHLQDQHFAQIIQSWHISMNIQ